MRSIKYYNVEKLSKNEKREINGGLAWYIPIIVGALIVNLISDWKNFKAGLLSNPPINN